MSNAFERLLLVGRRRPQRDESPAATVAGSEAVDDGSTVLEDRALESALGAVPALLPSAIFRQVVFDPTESTPAWAIRRPAPPPEPATAPGPVIEETAVAAAPATDEPKPAARARRAKANSSSGVGRTRSKRSAKSQRDADGEGPELA